MSTRNPKHNSRAVARILKTRRHPVIERHRREYRVTKARESRRRVRWGMGRRYPLSSQLGGLGRVVSSSAGTGPRPKKILVLSGGARTALVTILVAYFAFFPQILRLNHHQLGCRPSLSAPARCCRSKRYSRSAGSILRIFFALHNTPSIIPSPFLYPSFPLFFPHLSPSTSASALRSVDPYIHVGCTGERSAL